MVKWLKSKCWILNKYAENKLIIVHICLNKRASFSSFFFKWMELTGEKKTMKTAEWCLWILFRIFCLVPSTTDNSYNDFLCNTAVRRGTQRRQTPSFMEKKWSSQRRDLRTLLHKAGTAMRHNRTWSETFKKTGLRHKPCCNLFNG